METGITRRGALGAVLAAGAWSLCGSAAKAEQPKAVIEEIRVISWKPPLYHGWPTLARRRNGELLLAFSGGREAHVCPFGRLELMRSADDGRTWGWPQVLYDGPIDERDAGVVETPKGSLLVTTFTSVAYAALLAAAEKLPADLPSGWTAIKLAEWQAAHRRISDQQRKGEEGAWILRSTDGGVTWSSRSPIISNSPHGPIALRDGRMLYPGREWTGESRAGVCQSTDDGVTWDWLGTIPTRPGDNHREYHELHGVECNDGTLIVQIRNHNKPHDGETLQTKSTDGGKTWSIPQSINVWGHPSHLLKLSDGRLLMSYGYRRAPLGNQARISVDCGETWSEPIIISGDGTTTDLGYPSTVECKDGTLVTVWYEVLKGSPNAQLRQARWRLG